MDNANAPRAQFTAMTEGTQGDWDIIRACAMEHSPQGGRRVLDHLKLLADDFGGFPIDRLQHCLQTATRAHRDGRSESYVVMALLHDIGDTLGAYNHPDIAAAILGLVERKVGVAGQRLDGRPVLRPDCIADAGADEGAQIILAEIIARAGLQRDRAHVVERGGQRQPGQRG